MRVEGLMVVGWFESGVWLFVGGLPKKELRVGLVWLLLWFMLVGVFD